MNETDPLEKYNPRFGRGLFDLKRGNTAGITSDQIKDFMSKKYKLDVGEGQYDAEGNLNSFFIKKNQINNYTKKLNKSIYKKPKGFFGKLFSPSEDSKDKKRALLYGLAAGDSAGKHGKIVMDQELREKAPEVTAHELGHAVNYGTSKFRNIWSIGRHPVTQIAGIVAGPSLSIYGLMKNNKALAYGGAALTAAPGIATLTDEAVASIRGSKSMKEMGGTPNKSRLIKALGTYANAYAPNLMLAGTLAAATKKHFNTKIGEALPYFNSIYNHRDYKRIRDKSLRTGNVDKNEVSNIIKNRSEYSLKKIEPKYHDIKRRIQNNLIENKDEFKKRRKINTLAGYMAGYAIAGAPAFYLAQKEKIPNMHAAMLLSGLVGAAGGYLGTTIKGKKKLEYPTIMEKDIKIYKDLANPKTPTHKKYLENTLKWEFEDPIKKSLVQTGKYKV